ncbi:MAG: hypothetical protein EOO06_08305 [Chitinophagaceae bacterium]|nr:MAG: hypothetical protein EOO06_08305 [Chitinophagaceae bacterium]
MNEITRYDQALANELESGRLPSEDMAWAEMRKLLEEDSDDPIAIPWYRRTGCGWFALIGLLVGGVGLYWLFYTNREEQLPTPVPISGSTLRPVVGAGRPAEAWLPDADSLTSGNKLPQRLNEGGSATAPGEILFSRSHEAASPGKAVAKVASSDAVSDSRGQRTENFRSVPAKTKVQVQPSAPEGDADAKRVQNAEGLSEGSDSPGLLKPGSSIHKTGAAGADGDSGKKSISDTMVVEVPRADTIKQSKPEDNKEKRSSWMLASGLSVSQTVPLKDEPTVPYNFYGRKGSLSDYLPAIDFRLYRTKKWFVHTGFRYGAPQAVAPFNYKEVIRDSMQSIFKTRYQLQKTYYHQVPLSFHYYVLPNLSIGAGLIYNHFSAAIAQQEIFRSGGGAVDTLLSVGVVKDRDAGKLIRNHLQWSGELLYQWRRLTLGGRYSADISPYIKFAEIGTGNSIEKKSRALNVFIRFELWRSKKR